MGDIVEVVIQVGSTGADAADGLVTTVHGLDAIRQGGKKMNHTALCGYMAKSMGCVGEVETSEDDATYVFQGDMRDAARTFLLQLEKLPFHKHPESVVVNAGAWELRGEGVQGSDKEKMEVGVRVGGSRSHQFGNILEMDQK